MIAVMVARWACGARAALATVALALAALLAPAAAPAGAVAAESPTPAPSTSPSAADVSLQLAATPQGTLAPGEALDLTLVVTNAGGTPVEGGGIRYSITEHPLVGRAALDDWFDPDGEEAATRELVHGISPAVGSGISSSPLTTRIPAASLALPAGESSAVYGVEAALETGGTTLTGRAVFVWNPRPASPTGVAAVLPITTPTSVHGLVGANELQTFTSATGILTRLLDGLSGHPDVTLAVDPRLIASIRALGSAVPPSAADWLRRLESLPNPSFALQFGDADAAAQTQSGLTQLLQPTSLAYALDPARFASDVETLPDTPTPSPTETPTTTATPAPNVPGLESLLAWAHADDAIAWPASSVRTADLAAFASNGLTTTIVSSSRTDASRLAATPGAHVRVGENDVLLSDDALSEALGAAAMATSEVAWSRAMGRMVAELAALGAERGPSSRIVLATLPRGVWPASGFRLAQTLTVLEGSPWSAPSTLAAARLAAPATNVALREATESKERLATVHRLLQSEQAVQQFATVLVRPELLTGETRARLLVLLATAWSRDADDWETAADQAVQQNAETVRAVRIVSNNANYNLVANEGSIPVTVTNPLPYAVRVELHANPSNGRLAIERVSAKTIPADSRGIVLVPVKAQLGNGRVELSLQLTSQTGVLIGPLVVVPVAVNADWEGIGAFVVGGLLVLLFGFGLVRNIRRRRRERAADASAEDADGAAGDDTGDDATGDDSTGDDASPPETADG